MSPHRVWVDEERNTYDVESRFGGGVLTRGVPGRDEAEALERATSEYPEASHRVLRKTEDVGYVPLTSHEERVADEQERRVREADVLRRAIAIADRDGVDVREALRRREGK